MELGNKNGLRVSYGNQAIILKAWGRLDEAKALRDQQQRVKAEIK